MKDQMIQMAPQILMLVLSTVLPILAGLAAKLVNAKLKGNARDIVIDVATTAYNVVEKLAAKSGNKIDDKCAHALGVFVDALGRKATPEEVLLARATFAKLSAQPPGSLLINGMIQ